MYSSKTITLYYIVLYIDYFCLKYTLYYYIVYRVPRCLSPLFLLAGADRALRPLGGDAVTLSAHHARQHPAWHGAVLEISTGRGADDLADAGGGALRGECQAVAGVLPGEHRGRPAVLLRPIGAGLRGRSWLYGLSS